MVDGFRYIVNDLVIINNFMFDSKPKFLSGRSIPSKSFDKFYYEGSTKRLSFAPLFWPYFYQTTRII